jgi:hypothetical protein
VYYKAPDGWKRLEELRSFGQAHKYLMVPDVENTYRGAEAPVQISDRRPIFVVRIQPDRRDLLTPLIRNLVIVRFDKEKDHRELQIMSGGLFASGYKTGVSKKENHMPDLTVHSISDLVWSVTLNQDLKPGEYMLTWDSMGSFGYDFGIKK